MKARKTLSLPRSTKLSFYLLFSDREESNEVGVGGENGGIGTFVALDFAHADLNREVELVGIDEGSTLLCYTLT